MKKKKNKIELLDLSNRTIFSNGAIISIYNENDCSYNVKSLEEFMPLEEYKIDEDENNKVIKIIENITNCENLLKQKKL